MKANSLTERIRCELCGHLFRPSAFFKHWHEDDVE